MRHYKPVEFTGCLGHTSHGGNTYKCWSVACEHAREGSFFRWLEEDLTAKKALKGLTLIPAHYTNRKEDSNEDKIVLDN